MKLLYLFSILLYSCPCMAQPVVVKDINPGVFSSDPSRLTVFQGQLWFFADDGVNGNELWQTTGKLTSPLRDIYKGSKDAAPISPNKRMAELSGRLYFPADDGHTGLELYSVDGAGNILLASDIRGGDKGSGIDELVTLGDKVYFDANNGVFGKELFTYDPALKQASCVSFINPGIGDSDPDWLTPMNGKLYFTAYEPSTGRELYEYDPIADQVRLLADIYPGNSSSAPSCLTTDGSKLYFTAITHDYGRELYMYDGSKINRLTDLNQGSADGLYTDINAMRTIGIVGSALYFAGDNGAGGFQLYQYDLLNSKVSAVGTINKGGSSYPAGFVYYSGKVFFTADDGVHGRELWVLNKNTPSLVADINTNTAVHINPESLTLYDNKLFFTAYGSKGNELYVYVDAAAGLADPIRIADISVYPNPATDKVHISLALRKSEKISVVVTDENGRTVIVGPTGTYKPGKHVVTLPLSDVSPGVYYYKINNATGSPIAVGKILKI